ncbi:hypothetical protein Hypma_008041 [Hypsizygus marmoreus]|uniref:FAD dependent oxidoreductase domain-containing protein n=1 Tax=Hypsizygus marmoreus TaxID=39966 RepID=A0A369JU75_HYPMA|nr:hypothetical protein Hypma_008041 [Hypsizygus marmoreus]
MPLDRFDVIVVGGGPMGLSTAYECAKVGKRVLILEKFVFFNQSGSSGDLVRMFRTAYTEDFMADLAFKTMALWNDLEAQIGPLRVMNGLLNFGDPNYGAGGPEGTLTGPIPNLEKYGMRYRRLTRDQIEEENPFQNLPDSWEGLDIDDNGVINVPLLTRSLYQLCEHYGVRFMQYADVKRIRPDLSTIDSWIVDVELGSDKGSSVAPAPYHASAPKIALTCGAYVNHVLYPSFNFTLNLSIWEMTSMYFQMDSKVTFPKMWFQFAEDTPESKPVSNLFYGFPAVPWGPPGAARIAVDAATRIVTDPDQRSPTHFSSEDLENTRQWVRQHIVGVGEDPVPVFASGCLQTNVYDNMFVLDYIPDQLLPALTPSRRHNSIAVFTAGWGMKFVPLIGKILKELLVDGHTQYDISQFKIDRSSSEGHIINYGPVGTGDRVTSYAKGSSLRR